MNTNKKSKSLLMSFLHVFIPLKGNGFRPHAIRHKPLSIYSLGLILSQLLFGIYSLGPSVLIEDPLAMSKEIITLTNQERSARGISVLSENEKLDQAAREKLIDMFDNNYWDHKSPDGKQAWDFIRSENYDYLLAGENLAKGFNKSTTVVEAWMNSETHKANIVNANFKQIGVAIGTGVIDGQDVILIVQVFATPKGQAVASNTGGTDNALVLGQAINKYNLYLENAGLPEKIPYLMTWTILFSLIIFDGVMLRKGNLHKSRKHLFAFRSALFINGLALLLLCVNISAVL